MLDIFKTLIWVIIAFLFGILSVYSYLSFKPLKTQMKEVKEADKNVKVIIGGINYTEPLIEVCKAIRSIIFTSTIAAVISAITAILSIYI